VLFGVFVCIFGAIIDIVMNSSHGGVVHGNRRKELLR